VVFGLFLLLTCWGLKFFKSKLEEGAGRRLSNVSAAINSMWILNDSRLFGLCFDWKKKKAYGKMLFFFHS